MELRRETLFPTHIYIAEDVLEPTELDTIENSLARWPGNYNLHLEPQTQPLCDRVLQIADTVIEQNSWTVEGRTLTGMWANLDRPGDVHLPHTHSNCILSGVYYIDAEETSSIEFWDPRPAAHVLHPRTTTYTRSNSKVWAVAPTNNSVVMFPSWLQHYVKKNETNRTRLSMAFNIQLTGLVGDPAQLQAAEF